MTATLNNLDCTEIRATLPRYGVWHAIASLDDSGPLPETAGGASLSVAGLSLLGTVVDQGERGGTRSVEIVGGYGGWRRQASPRGHRKGNAVRLSEYARLLAEAQGERLTMDPSLDRPLGQIVARLGGLDGASLLTQACASPPGAAPVPWWVAPDGTTRLETRLGAAFDFEDTDRDDLDRWRSYATDDATPALPGSTVAGRIVEELRITADAGGSRLVVTFGDVAPTPGDGGQTVASWLRRIVLRVIGPHVSASRIYRYRITGILGDGRYSAKPVRAMLAPDLDGLALWPGIGGGRTRPAQDCVALVQFADGDIGFPVVVGFQPGVAGTAGLPTVTELDGLRVNLGDGATGERMARLTDGTGGNSFSYSNNISPDPPGVTITFTPPSGPPTIFRLDGAIVVTPVSPPLSVNFEVRSVIDIVGQSKAYA